MQRLVSALLLAFGAVITALHSQALRESPTPISEKSDLAHRNREIHWPKGRTPTDAQSFSHNDGYIGASCEKTFKYLAHPETWPSYLVFAKDVQMKHPGPLAKGSRFRWVIFGNSIESEIVELEPARRIAWINLKSKFYQTWLFQPEGTGCLVTTEEAGFGPAAVHITATGDTGTHRAHDLWLASLRWIAEGDTSSD